MLICCSAAVGGKVSGIMPPRMSPSKGFVPFRIGVFGLSEAKSLEAHSLEAESLETVLVCATPIKLFN